MEFSRVHLIQGVRSIQVPIQVTCHDNENAVKPVLSGLPQGMLSVVSPLYRVSTQYRFYKGSLS